MKGGGRMAASVTGSSEMMDVWGRYGSMLCAGEARAHDVLH